MTKNKKNDKQIADELNACFESMLTSNASVASCLTRYPQHAAELKPLLETMKAARAAGSLSPDPSFRAHARYEFRSALYDSMSPKKRPALGWQWRWATIISTAGVFLLTSTGGVVAASSISMPGQTLYQVKRTIENVQLTMTPSLVAKARLYATLADRRVSEIVYAATQLKDAGLTEDLTQQFTNDLSMVSSIVAPSRAFTVDGSKQAGTSSMAGTTSEQSPTTNNATGATNSSTSPAVPSIAVAPATTTTNNTTGATNYSTSPAVPPITVATAPAPTLIIAPPAQVTVTAAAPVPTSTFVLPQPTITISGINDTALLKLLQQYSVKNLAELMSILDKVPPSVKAALLAAIQAATSGYGQILGS